VSGLFVVPLFAAVQSWSPTDRRARVIGAVNTLNSVYMVVGSLLTTLVLKLAGVDETTVFIGLGVANLLAAFYFFARLPVDYRGMARARLGRERP
jgi:acyl-[acyl-carrier-protein]-phospholipid O-acyltransferase/long-chain-fatty-acid--[acyl-carrier-protein] ligase